jgi:hypothetical protein
VYESMFGNTQRVAQAITHGLATRMTARATAVTELQVATFAQPDLLVVGAPTHGLNLPTPDTRLQAAVRSDDEIDTRTGIREFLAALPSTPGRLVATFDTRHRLMRYLPGSAARAAGRLLNRAGCRLVVPAQSFYVAGMAGPLLPGEWDRAVDWGEQLGRLAQLVRPPVGKSPPEPVGEPDATHC